MTHFEFNSKNTFCISLADNLVRFNKMKNRFNKINLDVTFWNAVTSEKLNRNFVHYLNNGQRGCAQSHLEIWEHIIKNDIEYALILEDDACFDNAMFEKLEQFWTDINDNEWDALFLNGSEPMNTLNKWEIIYEQYLTAGYIVSKRGCIKLVNMYSGCLYGADWMTTRLQLYNHSYCYFPWLIIQEGNETTIGSNLENDHFRVIDLLGKIDYSIDNYTI